MNENIKKYSLKSKTDRPSFEYMVRQNSGFDYYLYSDFDSALKKMVEISISKGIGLLYEIYFNNQTREYFGHNTFKAFDGEVKYDKHAKVDLHLHFYINAGEWLNPDVELMR